MKWGVVAALPHELKPTLARLRAMPDAKRLLFSVGGVGASKAAACARKLAEQGAELLISTGFAGALVEGLETGDLVLNGTPGPAFDRARRAAPDARHGATVSVDRVALGSPEKARLAAENGAVAVDMESAAVGRVAEERGLPFLCVKAILDTPGRPLASRYESVGAVLAEILRRPRTLTAIFADGARAKLAASRLADFYEALAAGDPDRH